MIGDSKLVEIAEGIKLVIGQHGEIIGCWDGNSFVNTTEFDQRLKSYAEQYEAIRPQWGSDE